jgi:hypothetical protein
VTKQACLCLTALSATLRASLDACSDWLITPLLARTGNGTGVIAASASLAVIKYVTNVCGKQISKLLRANADHLSVDVRVTVVKCMLLAREFWTPEMSSTFADTLRAKQADASERVRSLFAAPEEQQPIPVADLIQDDSDEPPPAVGLKSLVELIDEKDTPEIERFIRVTDPKPSLVGYMQGIVDLLIIDFNEEEGVEPAVNLLALLCGHYKANLYPFLNQLFLDLPQDERLGLKCLDCLGAAFGLVQIAKLVRKSSLSYVNDFILKTAQGNPVDIDLQCKAILNVIDNGFYERFYSVIIFLLKRIYASNPNKCEALFAAIPLDKRSEIIQEIQDEIPQLFQVFNYESVEGLSEKLAGEIEKAKAGEDVDLELIWGIHENDPPNLLLAIAVIRELSTFNDRFIPFLLKATRNGDAAVVGAASIALQRWCDARSGVLRLIVEAFVETNAAWKAFGKALQAADRADAVDSLNALHEALVKAIENPSLKYSALGVVAKAIVYCGDEYQSFAGELPPINAKLLASMIETEQKPK